MLGTTDLEKFKLLSFSLPHPFLAMHLVIILVSKALSILSMEYDMRMWPYLLLIKSSQNVWTLLLIINLYIGIEFLRVGKVGEVSEMHMKRMGKFWFYWWILLIDGSVSWSEKHQEQVPLDFSGLCLTLADLHCLQFRLIQLAPSLEM